MSYTCKEIIEIIKSIVTISAILFGGFWTYNNFIKERKNYPHAIVEQKISHVPLSETINLLRVEIVLTNTGTSSLSINESTILVQQILPLLPCTGSPCPFDEVNTELEKVQKEKDRFSWPILSEREKKFSPPLDIEPGERDVVDFEFVFSSDVKLVRVYSYFQNEEKISGNSGLGWGLSKYYDFSKNGKEKR